MQILSKLTFHPHKKPHHLKTMFNLCHAKLCKSSRNKSLFKAPTHNRTYPVCVPKHFSIEKKSKQRRQIHKSSFSRRKRKNF